MSISLWHYLSSTLRSSELDEVCKVVGRSVVDSNKSCWMQLEALIDIISENCGKKSLRSQVFEKMLKKFDNVNITRVKSDLSNTQVCYYYYTASLCLTKLIYTALLFES